MNDDTISNDPKMLEEARRAVSDANLPKLTFDPKTVAKEVWDDVASKNIGEKFEDFWKGLTIPDAEREREVLLALKEHEFRQFMVGLVYMADALRMKAEAERLARESTTLRDAVFSEVNRRVMKDSGKEAGNITVELHSGMARKGSDTCPLHPDGCAKHDAPGGLSFLGAVPIGPNSSPEAVKAVTELLKSLMAKK